MVSQSTISGLELATNPKYPSLKTEIEAFLFYEAELLDSRDYDTWLTLLSEDLTYFMPMRRASSASMGSAAQKSSNALASPTILGRK